MAIRDPDAVGPLIRVSGKRRARAADPPGPGALGIAGKEAIDRAGQAGAGGAD